VSQPFRRRDRLDHRLDSGRLRGRHLRAVARALAALHDGAEPCGDAAPAAPLALAKQARAYADAFETRPHSAGATADLERLLAAQQRFLIDAIETLLERAGSGRVRRIHGRLDCRSVWVKAAWEARFANADPHACGDIAEDVASLAVDLRARQAAPAEAFAAAYAWPLTIRALPRSMASARRRPAHGAAARRARNAHARTEAGCPSRAAPDAAHPAL
jgi:aminoglycoside phosphotransferase family enzyme